MKSKLKRELNGWQAAWKDFWKMRTELEKISNEFYSSFRFIGSGQACSSGQGADL
jgi:hypothetical protein